MDKVIAGEMTKEEAYRRNNYYLFASRCPGISSPARYVLETPTEELPPFTMEVYDPGIADELQGSFTNAVSQGLLTAYEAAEEYYLSVRMK